MKNIINLAKHISDKASALGRGAPPHWYTGSQINKHREPETQFAKAAQIVDRRDGYAIKLMRTWQCFSVLSIATAATLGYGWYQQAQKSQIERYFVRVDEFGEVSNVVITGSLIPAKQQYIAAGRAFVINAFARSSDQSVNKQRFDDLQKTIAGSATQKWNEWSRDAYKTADEREIDVIGWKQKSADNANPMTWEIIWQEIDTKDSTKRFPRTMNGDFTIEYRPTKKTRELLDNPSGMFITDMTIGEQRRM